MFSNIHNIFSRKLAIYIYIYIYIYRTYGIAVSKNLLLLLILSFGLFNLNLQEVYSQSNINWSEHTPNPFDQTTSISYYIPERLYPPFEIITTNLDGSIVYDRIPTENKIPKTITISAANYQTGVYVYTIMNAGRVIKSEK
jgi:hypothetical protein